MRVLWLLFLIIFGAASLLAGCAPKPAGPTGIDYVDDVIAAIQSDDHQVLSEHVVLSTVPCTPEKWLLNRPLCAEGEAEGTLVQALPLLSDDLGFLRPAQINAWHGMGDARLYAVYSTGDYVYADEYFPKGEYAVAFLPPGTEFAFIFQVTPAGIVRIDTCGIRLDICHGEEIEQLQDDHPDAFILGPLEE